MLRARLDGTGAGVRIEIGDQRLPPGMIARRVWADVRPSATVRTQMRRQVPYAAVVMAVVFIRMISMSRRSPIEGRR